MKQSPPENFRYIDDCGATVAMLLPVFQGIDEMRMTDYMRQRMNLNISTTDRATLSGIFEQFFKENSD